MTNACSMSERKSYRFKLRPVKSAFELAIVTGMSRLSILLSLVVLSMTAASAQTDYLARAKALHARALLIDGHNDYPWALREHDPARDLDKLDIGKPQPT